MRLLVILSFCVSSSLAVFECGSHETTAFVRIARARLDGTPVVVSTAGRLFLFFENISNSLHPIILI